MVKFLVEHGACIFAATLSDQETAAEKCEEDEEGFDGCSEYLYSKHLLYLMMSEVMNLNVMMLLFRHSGEAGDTELWQSIGRLRLRGSEFRRVEFRNRR